MLREIALKYLQGRRTSPGETVQIGWNVLRITEGTTGLDVESLDFKRMASYTTDLGIAEQVHWAQEETLRLLGVEAEDCTLVQSAVVSRSYVPGSLHAFLERSSAAKGHDSGWYVGMQDDPLSVDDVDSFILASLYELSIHDERLARWWLLPVGYRIFLTGEEPTVTKVAGGASDGLIE